MERYVFSKQLIARNRAGCPDPYKNHILSPEVSTPEPDRSLSPLR